MLADALVAHGIGHVFAVPGESYLDVLDGLYAVRDRVRLYTCRFEAGAVNAAEAHGKLTGRPAAAMVTRGPGACHASIGVHVAMQDSTPLLLFVGLFRMMTNSVGGDTTTWTAQFPAVSGLREGDDVRVPDEMEQARTRAIQEELRRRGAERTRPQPELDYIDRLLRPF